LLEPPITAMVDLAEVRIIDLVIVILACIWMKSEEN